LRWFSRLSLHAVRACPFGLLADRHRARRSLLRSGAGFLAVLLVAAPIAACTSMGPTPQRLGQTGVDRVFRLGSGDRLKVTVFGEEELSADVDVDAAGNVTLPLVGVVAAKGQTLEQFTASLGTRLADGFLKNPKIGVQVINYRPIYVQGEVRQGGEFAYKLGLKVADAVALAGGYSYRADQTYVQLRREGDTQQRAVLLEGDVVVLPGDNLLIPERFF
jgi:polysaccharide biosynthesis/export protein